MRSARLSHAVDTAALTLPEGGAIAVLRPRGEDDLSALPKARLILEQGFRPDHDSLAGQGYQVAPSLDAGPGSCAAVLVCLPRTKAESRALVARAVWLAGPEGLVIVDGQKTDGIDAMLRDLRARVPVGEPVSKAHGKLFAFHPGAETLADWQSALHLTPEGFYTTPGVFSADGPDRASVLLAAALPGKLPGRIADLGAGWGYLAHAMLTRDTPREVHLIEAEASALDCARRNVTDPRAQFHWADATTFKPDKGFDAIVCNPPFHVSRNADPAVGAAFLTAAARLLAPHGTLWLVANRHLPYDRTLSAAFREVEDLGGDASFKLTRAARPARARI